MNLIITDKEAVCINSNLCYFRYELVAMSTKMLEVVGRCSVRQKLGWSWDPLTLIPTLSQPGMFKTIGIDL